MEVSEENELSGGCGSEDVEDIDEPTEVQEKEVKDTIEDVAEETNWDRMEVKPPFRPSVGITFESVEEAKDAFNDYASEIGFGIKSRSYLLLLTRLGISIFDRVQIRSRVRARRRHLAIFSEDIGAALIYILL
ncbi:hypothetical protein Scep_018710 [Stephania cephalantha]|uniref:Uncharacterized protein n=1 Tax=Stephania cephalantha TaxID=152367 RepID=A0AAP0NP30_9MAGN